MVIALGWMRNHVATHLGIDPGPLSRWRRQSAFQQEVAELLDQAKRDSVEPFRLIKREAVERQSDLVDSLSQMVALRAVDMGLSKTVLNRALALGVDCYEERSDAQFVSPVLGRFPSAFIFRFVE